MYILKSYMGWVSLTQSDINPTQCLVVFYSDLKWVGLINVYKMC